MLAFLAFLLLALLLLGLWVLRELAAVLLDFDIELSDTPKLATHQD